MFLVEPPPRLVELRVWIEPPNAKAGRMVEEAATLVDAMASEAGACEVGARAAAAAVRRSKEELPVRIMLARPRARQVRPSSLRRTCV